MQQFFVRYKTQLIYGASLAALLFLLKWLEMRFIIMYHAFDIYIGAIAIIFTALGIWLALKLAKPKTIVVEKEIIITSPNSFIRNGQEQEKLGISQRELEVLELMAQGLSNQEIANRLFVSLNTIKTHSSNLFLKLDVKRRTQAVDIAKKLNIIP